jgi:acetyl esterase/lipase
MAARGVAFGVVLAVVATIGPPGSTTTGPAVPVGAIAPERYVDPIFSEVTVTKDLVFGAAPDFGGKGTQQLDLDIYEPTGDTLAKRPLVVLAFGGGFYFGDKEQLAPLAEEYARRGFVAASITYRLDEDGGLLSYPLDNDGLTRVIAAKHDLQAAIRWLRSEAVTYRVDPGKVAVGGVSAGAVTALVAALLSDDPGSSGTPGLSSRVCTAISIAGTAGGGLAGPGDAGAIFFHGTDDELIPYELAELTEGDMREAGLPTRLVTYPGGRHDIYETEFVDYMQRSSEWMVEQVVDRTDSCAGPIDPYADAFATAAHHDLLGRAPTGDELARMVNLLDSGASRGMVLTGLTSSDEWLGAIVTDLYTDTLGRGPDAAGLAYWIGALRSGRFTVAQVAASFYAAAEHRAASGSATAWIADLYDAILGRPASSEDVAYWSAQLATNGPSWVAGRLYGSLESRRDRVTALYEHLLARAPDTDGLAYWADRIARVGDLGLARHLAASAEYRARAITRFG